jgi:hypothetical protein
VPTSIKTDNANGKPDEKESKIKKRKESFWERAEPLPSVEKKPEDSRDAVGEPAGEETGYEAEKVVEDGDTGTC